jgi:hypothetical protein
MAAFPTDIKFEWRDFGEEAESVVLRTEMERGVPKQRRVKSDAMVTMQLTMNFKTKAALAAFETFFWTTTKAGQDWFTMTHPRNGSTINARFAGGKMGSVRHLTVNLENTTVTSQIEYLRSAY